ncbi:preprotein translocase subunit SecY [bacterium]|nr:preprotein translocase subunit SecY [bacterium]
MIAALLNIFKVPELRRKVFITLALLLVYRIGAHVPSPFIDPAAASEKLGGAAAGMFGIVDMFSGGAFSQMTLFALGIMPYISASIVIQLLAAVWPRLEKISKEGEAGRKKITQYTRYGTVGLAFFQGVGIGVWLLDLGISRIPQNPTTFLIITAMTMCTGTCFIMWLGEKITQHGIGTGISLIIAVGIIARYPLDFRLAWLAIKADTMSPMGLIMLLALTIIVSALIIINQQASRRVPIQHAQRMVGHKIMRGGNTYIPLKLNTAGVIPVIFASAILSFPSMILPYLGADRATGLGAGIIDWMSRASQHNLYDAVGITSGGIFALFKILNVYTISYIILTAAFCFFYTAITLNPVDLADNLKKSNAFIPGIKPGKHTADYIDHILMRITVVGAAILIVIALVPEVLAVSYGFNWQVAQVSGGTGLIIVVGVFLDTMKQIESQLMMRHYEGFKFAGAGLGGRRPTIRTRRPVRGGS